MVHTRRHPKGHEAADVAASVVSPDNVNELDKVADAEQVVTPNTSPVRPSASEMHPDLYHHSTTKPLDRAAWSDFQSRSARPELLQNASGKVATAQATPTKANATLNTTDCTTNSPSKLGVVIASPSVVLNPEARAILHQTRKKVQESGATTSSNLRESGVETSQDSKIRTAKPQTKPDRFKGVHDAVFRKMPSINDDHSVRHRRPPAVANLKRSPSKAELDVQERTNTKASHVKTRSNIGGTAHPTDEFSAAKRVKRSKGDDASTVRRRVPTSDESNSSSHSNSGGAVRSNSRDSRILQFTAATKSSAARSVDAIRKRGAGTARKPTGKKDPITPLKTSASSGHNPLKGSHNMSGPSTLKSIIRDPVRQYSTDPQKRAAGTHMTSPNLDKDHGSVSASRAAGKQVAFSEDMPAAAEKDKVQMARASSNHVEKATPTVQPRTGDVAKAGQLAFSFGEAIAFSSGITRPTIRHVSSDPVSDPSRSHISKPTSASQHGAKVLYPIPECEKENKYERRRLVSKKAQAPTKTIGDKKVGACTQTSNNPRKSLSERLNKLAQPKRRQDRV